MQAIKITAEVAQEFRQLIAFLNEETIMLIQTFSETDKKVKDGDRFVTSKNALAGWAKIFVEKFAKLFPDEQLIWLKNVAQPQEVEVKAEQKLTDGDQLH